MDTLTVSIESPDADDVRALLQRHFDLMRANSPAESCHVMEPEQLGDDNVVMYGARKDGILLAIGAIKTIDVGHGELKSMHTAIEARGMGLARTLLEMLIDHAKTAGLHQISLETGTAEEFKAARKLYERHDFTTCAPFGTYQLDPLSTYMTRSI